MSVPFFIYMNQWLEDLETAEDIVQSLHGDVHFANRPLTIAFALRLYGHLSPDEMQEELPAITQAGYGRYVGPTECQEIIDYIMKEDCLEWRAWLAPKSEYEALKREASE